MLDPTALESWHKLQTMAKHAASLPMAELFKNDPARAQRMSLECPHIYLDYSKNRIQDTILVELFALSREVALESWRDRMFAGEPINCTEGRAVLHVALRNRGERLFYSGAINISKLIEHQLAKMAQFVTAIRSGHWQGYSGKRITDVVSIGIGGSHLGPQMVTEALGHLSEPTLHVHYVANIDAMQIDAVLRTLNPETVLFVVSSKTFTTTETMTNARTAQAWLRSASSDQTAISKHFVAVSANPQRAIEFGIAADNVFEMWDWVGGRFSLWSAIGLPIALYLGIDIFLQLLEGAYQMDQHFEQAPLEQNAPVMLALLSVWNTNFLGCSSQAVLPYDQALHMLPAYLQQAEMESNGKSVNMDGQRITYATVPTIWGGLGVNGQHAYFQYLHQSNTIVPVDFIGSIQSNAKTQSHHDILMANFFAQTQALMQGVSKQQVCHQLTAKGLPPAQIDALVEHKIHTGNRPTNSLLLERITSQSLGALIALYEHKIFCQGIILGVCSFDQWGVELGKDIAANIEQELKSGILNSEHDASTRQLIARYQSGQS